jgi:iron complex outermembrane receptor protein
MAPVALYASYTISFNPLPGMTFHGRDFEPEEGVQYEGGMKFDLFGGRLSSTLALYHLTREDVQTSNPDHPTFSTQTGEQRRRGVEVDIAGNIVPGFRLIGSYAYTDAKITKTISGTQGNWSANVPEHTGSV